MAKVFSPQQSGYLAPLMPSGPRCVDRSLSVAQDAIWPQGQDTHVGYSVEGAPWLLAQPANHLLVAEKDRTPPSPNTMIKSGFIWEADKMLMLVRLMTVEKTNSNSDFY